MYLEDRQLLDTPWNTEAFSPLTIVTDGHEQNPINLGKLTADETSTVTGAP